MSTWVIMLLVATAVYGLLFIKNKANKPRRLKVLNTYYEKNRKEFPWLDNWLKENPNVAEERIKGEKGSDILLYIVFYVAIVLIILIFKKWTFIHFILIAGSAIFLLLGEWLKKDANFGAGALEFEIECPSCHCPHAWVMTQEELFVEGENATVTTTTYSDFSQKKDISGESYNCRIIEDFKCLNCGHTEQEKRSFTSIAGTGCPKEGVKIFDPPKPAWNPKR